MIQNKKMETEKIIKAGKIASEIKAWIKPIIKKDMPLLEIAELIENKIIESGGKPAFPVNLSINEIAAHYTPTHDDETKAHGLLKIDFGVHIDGWISDNAFSIDLENSETNKKLIEASRKALENAQDKIDVDITTSEIGEKIEETISAAGFNPIINLSGHQIEQYDLHAGLTIPNFDDKKNDIITEGLYAIEPFATNGVGKVHDGKPSGIYVLIDNTKNIRNPNARKILEYISDEYETIPFCSRNIVKEFGNITLFSLRQLEQNGNIHQFPQLIESGNGIVAQTENTILVKAKNDKIITTE